MLWNVLHDGAFTELHRDGGDLIVKIQIEYLLEKLLDKPIYLQIRLCKCSIFEYTPWDEEPISDLQKIQACEPEILSAESQLTNINMVCVSGMIRTSYAEPELILSTGSSITVNDLAKVAKEYWEEFAKRAQANRLQR